MTSMYIKIMGSMIFINEEDRCVADAMYRSFVIVTISSGILMKTYCILEKYVMISISVKNHQPKEEKHNVKTCN